MTHKGMSQTLALIVAASVLMMTALTVIFMVQGGLGDINQDTSSTSCRSTIQAICAGTSGTVNPPSTCYSDGSRIPNAPNYVPATQDGQVQCSQVNS